MNINNLIRIGTVSSIDPEKATARVLLEDRDMFVTGPLPIIFGRTLGTKDYRMVEVGEQVLCLFLNNGLEEGFILGSFYNENIESPSDDPNKQLIKFEDGSIIEYDNGKITITATKDIYINGNVYINGTIHSSGGD